MRYLVLCGEWYNDKTTETTYLNYWTYNHDILYTSVLPEPGRQPVDYACFFGSNIKEFEQFVRTAETYSKPITLLVKTDNQYQFNNIQSTVKWNYINGDFADEFLEYY